MQGINPADRQVGRYNVLHNFICEQFHLEVSGVGNYSSLEMGAGTKVGGYTDLINQSRIKNGFQGFPADSGDSALFLCQRKAVRWLEKKMGEKKDFGQIAIMVKSNLIVRDS